MKKPYTRSIDWWCLGAVTYEMVYGLPPFYSTHVDEMYQGILHKPLKLKSTVSVEMRSFLSKILEKNPENRLGHAPDGWQQIQNHSFFRQINFSDLLLKKYRPDFIPAVVSGILVFSRNRQVIFSGSCRKMFRENDFTIIEKKVKEADSVIDYFFSFRFFLFFQSRS